LNQFEEATGLSLREKVLLPRDWIAASSVCGHCGEHGGILSEGRRVLRFVDSNAVFVDDEANPNGLPENGEKVDSIRLSVIADVIGRNGAD
jgi:hypothetical protein